MQLQDWSLLKSICTQDPQVRRQKPQNRCNIFVSSTFLPMPLSVDVIMLYICSMSSHGFLLLSFFVVVANAHLLTFEDTLADSQSHLINKHPTSNVGDDKCNGAGICKGRNLCANKKIKCAAKDSCHVAGTCFSGTGRCTNPVKKAGTKCDDNNKNTGVSANRHFFTCVSPLLLHQN